MLPPGLTLNSTTGEISGTIDSGAEIKTYPFTVKMCDQNDEHICCQRELSIKVEALDDWDWSVFNGDSCSDVDWLRTMTATASLVTVNGAGTTSGTVGGCFPTVKLPRDGVAVNVHVDITITQNGDNPEFIMAIGSSFAGSEYYALDTAGMGNGTFHFTADFSAPIGFPTVSISDQSTDDGGGATFNYTMTLTITAL